MVRTHISNDPELRLNKKDPVLKNHLFKPNGFWYAIGDAWVDWCKNEMPHWLTEYIYTFDFTTNANILLLDTLERVKDFHNEYKTPLEVGVPVDVIDWKRISNEYDGIEFNPYFYSIRLEINMMWYSGIDVPSGVVFDPSIIHNIKRMQLQKTV